MKRYLYPIILMGLVLVAEKGDYSITAYGMSMGHKEGNPKVAELMATMGVERALAHLHDLKLIVVGVSTTIITLAVAFISATRTVSILLFWLIAAAIGTPYALIFGHLYGFISWAVFLPWGLVYTIQGLTPWPATFVSLGLMGFPALVVRLTWNYTRKLFNS